MKKFIKVCLGFTALLVVSLFVIPFAIDFNQFKPAIKKIVSESLHADVEFSSARLTILTGLGVEIKEVAIRNTDEIFSGIPLLKTELLDFKIKLAPLLSGKLTGVAVIDGAQIEIVQDGFKNNIAALSKPKTVAGNDPESKEQKSDDQKISNDTAQSSTLEDESPQELSDEQRQMIEKVKKNVVIESFRLENTQFVFRRLNAAPGEGVRFSDINVTIEDIGLERDIITKISTEVSIREAGSDIQGPFQSEITTHIKTDAEKLELITVQGKFSFDSMAIKYLKAFNKAETIPLNLQFAIQSNGSDVQLENFQFNFHSLAMQVKGNVVNVSDPVIDFKTNFKASDIADLGQVLPQHKDMLTKASITLDAFATGPVNRLDQLKAGLDFKTKLAQSDLGIKLNIDSALGPKGNLNVASQKLDLDAILGPFLPPEGSSKGTESTGEAAKAGAKSADKPGSDTKKGNTSVAENPEAAPPEEFSLSQEQRELLQQIKFGINISMQDIIFSEQSYRNFLLKAYLKNLVAKLDPMSVDVFQGSVFMRGMADLNQELIRWDGAFKLNSVEISEILAMIKPEHKDIMHGIVDVSLEGTGQGTTMPNISKTMNAKGSYAFQSGKVNSGSLSQELVQQWGSFSKNLALSGKADKYLGEIEKYLNSPLAKKANLKTSFDPAAYKAKLDSLTNLSVGDRFSKEKSLKGSKGEFTVQEGKISITSKEESEAGDFYLDATASIAGALGGGGKFTAAASTKDSLVKQSPYASLLMDEGGNLVIPYSLSGTLDSPEVKFNLASIQERVRSQAESTIKKELDDELQKLKDSVLGGKLDEAKKRLEEERAKLKAKAEAKKKELMEKKRKAESEAKKKLEDRKKLAKKKADERKRKEEEKAKRKAEEKAKEKLKDEKMKDVKNKLPF